MILKIFKFNFLQMLFEQIVSLITTLWELLGTAIFFISIWALFVIVILAIYVFVVILCRKIFKRHISFFTKYYFVTLGFSVLVTLLFIQFA